eukprot:749257_1
MIDFKKHTTAVRNGKSNIFIHLFKIENLLALFTNSPLRTMHSALEGLVLDYSISVAFLSLCIYLPIAVFGVLEFYRYRKNSIIKKRYPQITFVISYLLIVVIITEGIRAYILVAKPQWTKWTFHIIISFLSSVAIWIILKSYLNYYAIRHSNAILSSEWKSVINPSTEHTNWFITNRHRYGSYTFWKPFAILNIFFNLFLCYIVECLDIHNSAQALYLNWVGIANALISIAAMIMIRMRTPKFHDMFHQREELRRIILFASICMALKISLHGVHFVSTNQLLSQVLYISEAWVFSTLSVWIVYTCTIWVIRKNKVWLKSNITIEAPLAVQTPDPTSDSSVNYKMYENARKNLDRQAAVVTNSNPERGVFQSCDRMLSTEKGFESMIFHLAQEFSTEIILCLIEMTQFQQLVHRFYTNHFCLDPLELDTEHWLKMPPNVPQSSIVSDIESGVVPSCVSSSSDAYIIYEDAYKELDAKQCNKHKAALLVNAAEQIYEKYVCIGSPLEVNISFKVRYKLTRAMVKLQMMNEQINSDIDEQVIFESIYQLFKPTMCSLRVLLAYVFNRFKDTALFQKLVDENGDM